MTEKQIDNVVPKGQWAFDAEVADAFDDMLRRSIPQYDVMRDAVSSVASAFQKNSKTFVDLGCSRGETIAPIVRKFGAQNHYVGVDESGSMLEAARKRFDGLIKCGVVDIREFDLRNGFPKSLDVCVTTSILTLQFVPITFRQRIVHECYAATCKGGAFVVVEKVIGECREIDEVLDGEYLLLKNKNGYSAEQILRKRAALEGVLVPITANWNVEMLRSAGFSKIDCFWRWMNFAGWVAVK